MCRMVDNKKGRDMKFKSQGKTYYIMSRTDPHNMKIVVPRADLPAAKLGNFIASPQNKFISICFILVCIYSVSAFILLIPLVLGFSIVNISVKIIIVLIAAIMPILIKGAAMSRADYNYIAQGYEVNLIEELVDDRTPIAQEAIDLYLSVGKGNKSKASEAMKKTIDALDANGSQQSIMDRLDTILEAQ